MIEGFYFSSTFSSNQANKNHFVKDVGVRADKSDFRSLGCFYYIFLISKCNSLIVIETKKSRLNVVQYRLSDVTKVFL